MEKPINSASFTPFPRMALKAPMTAVADVVRWCLTTLCGAAFYTAHRCSGKSDAFTIRPVPMVTEMDVVSWKMLLLVLPETAVKSTPSACVHLQSRGCKHNLRSLRDGEPVTVQCLCFIPLSIALWWQLSDCFIMLLNCGAVSSDFRSDRQVDIIQRQGAWLLCCSTPASALSLWCPRGLSSHGFAPAAEQLNTDLLLLNELWISHLDSGA